MRKLPVSRSMRRFGVVFSPVLQYSVHCSFVDEHVVPPRRSEDGGGPAPSCQRLKKEKQKFICSLFSFMNERGPPGPCLCDHLATFDLIFYPDF